MTLSPPRLIVLAGPTGVGKSALSLELAQNLRGEIVNADSMQIYRGMNIGTAKVTPAEQALAPHHLLDVLNVTDTASVAAYQRDARTCIAEILSRERTPIMVGGSGLYIQAVIDDMRFPGTDAAIRARLEQELIEVGAEVLRHRLAQQDPAAAAAITANNSRRIVRALEVIELTGRPFTATLPTFGPPRYNAALIYVDRDTGELDGLLADRVDAMMSAGLLAEVRELERHGLREGRTASRAVGYRQMLAVLDGSATLDEAVAETVVATRRLVRRQRSWFSRDQRWHAVNSADPHAMTNILHVIED